MFAIILVHYDVLLVVFIFKNKIPLYVHRTLCCHYVVDCLQYCYTYRTGYFYLTPDFGMDYVRNCTGRGFHEHPTNPPIFEVITAVHHTPSYSEFLE